MWSNAQIAHTEHALAMCVGQRVAVLSAVPTTSTLSVGMGKDASREQQHLWCPGSAVGTDTGTAQPLYHPLMPHVGSNPVLGASQGQWCWGYAGCGRMEMTLLTPRHLVPEQSCQLGCPHGSGPPQGPC